MCRFTYTGHNVYWLTYDVIFGACVNIWCHGRIKTSNTSTVNDCRASVITLLAIKYPTCSFDRFYMKDYFSPGGSNGDLLKSQSPNKYAHDDNFGFSWAFRKIFIVRSAWYTSQPHSRKGKSGLQVTSPEKRWFLDVLIALLAELRLYWFRGANSYISLIFF